MKSLFISVLLFLISTSGTVQAFQHPLSGEKASASRTILFNDGWLFHQGDHSPPFRFRDVTSLDTPTTREWRRLDLPHDWSVEAPFDSTLASSTSYLPGGIGWYQKSFDWSPDDTENVSIYFQAISSNSDVWLNGNHLGYRPNGYISFEHELNDYLVDGTNTLTVKVNRSKYADSRWYTGSGIYGDVKLIVRDEVFIPTWGVFVTTPEVSSGPSTVRAETQIRNTSTARQPVNLSLTILNPDGEPEDAAEVTDRLQAGRTHDLSAELNVSDSRLWSPDSPELYTLMVEVRQNDRVLDRRELPFGLRYFEFDPQEGFFLNGENTLIKGVCLHHDAGVFGAAVPREVWKRRLQILKEAGTNAIRISHNPAPPHLLDLADSMGFLVQAEAFDEWRHPKNKWISGWNVGEPGHDGYYKYFDEWAKRDLQDMVLRDRNHTSIIMWSIGNEIDYPNDPYSHPVLDETGEDWRVYEEDRPHADELGEIAEQLVAWTKEIDDTRPVTAALASAFMSNETGYPGALDIVGYNYQENRYIEDHAAYPDRVIYGSENADASYAAWQPVRDYPFISSLFIWTGVDYLGEAGAWPRRSNVNGILDLAGFKKARYYIQKSFWYDEPMVQVSAGRQGIPSRNSSLHWNFNDGTMTTVFGLTNQDEVELFVNGRSAGIRTREEFNDNGSAEWDIPFEPGTIRIDAYDGGEVVASSELKTHGQSDHLEVITDKDHATSSKKEIIHATVEVRDAEGILAATETHHISYEIDGPADVVGLESGSATSLEHYQSVTRDTYNGKLMIFLQTNGNNETGTVTLTVKSEGLEDGTARIEVR